MEIVRCPSCDGYGWFDDDMMGDGGQECDWCGGIGYVYRAQDGTDAPIPRADYARLADELEALERERLREMGYQGEAKKPWEQDVRQGTRGGINPYEEDAEGD